MPYLSANAFMSLGLETTRGTAAATPTDIPVNGPALTPMIQWLKDQNLRGSPVDDYDAVVGVRSDDLDVKGYVYADSFPILWRAILGGADTKTGSGPYSHVIGLANAPATGSQPPSVTSVLFDGANPFQMTGSQMVSLDLTFGADKPLEWTGKFTGNPWTVPSTPSPSWGTVPLIPAWNSNLSIGGSQVFYIESGDIKIDRKTAPIFTAGTQAPEVVFAGPIGITGSLSCVVLTTSDPFTIGGSAYGLTKQQKVCSWTFTEPTTSDFVTIQMSAVQFDTPKRNVGKQYTSIDVNFTAIANTTDATAGGYSPIQTTTSNQISTAYVGS